MSAPVLPMPSFEQAKGFAKRLGITNEEEWQNYLVNRITRDRLFAKVIAVATDGNVLDAELED